MGKTYQAIYYDESNYFYNATIYLSAVTITIRYKDEKGNQKDIHWLGEDIVSLDESELQSTLIYKNAAGKLERLVIRDPALLADVKYQFRHRRFAGKRLRRFTGNIRVRILAILGTILFLLGLLYFLFIPWIGEKIALSFSREKEIQLGEQLYRSVISGATVDVKKTKLINQFYSKLGYTNPYPIQITVVKSEEVNAFAVPGGHIVVFEGIIDNMESARQLAALLGHESAHVLLRHSIRNIFRNLAGKMFLLTILGGDGIGGYLATKADDLKGLQYSRGLETEADNEGMRLMTSSHINPEGMLELMKILQKEGEGKETSALLSTHPVFESRIRNIKQKINSFPNNLMEDTTLNKIFQQLKSPVNSF
jgi:Zn-dependent protease with chaperone function